VLVGDVNNPNDPADGDQFQDGVQNFGSVDHAYLIGKYEVTVGQYAEFLNAVAKSSDPYSLYDNRMMINQSCPGGNCTYLVLGSPNEPIAFVNWGQAARFANWLHNGQPTGTENAGTTEDGAYTLNGATSGIDLLAVTRNANAKWFIPTENEWYKAAYYQPAAQGGDSDGYWNYPMKTNSQPYSDQPPGNTPDNTRVGNFYWDDHIANGYDDGYAVTGSNIPSGAQNDVTDVGAYTSSPSYYGTFDQAGNLIEWNETAFDPFVRGIRGGSWISTPLDFAAAARYGDHPNFTANDYGFRVGAAVPEPGAAVLLVFAELTLGILRRRRA